MTTDTLNLSGRNASSKDPDIQQTMSRPGARLASGTVPAAAVTFGLFTFMYLAIGGYDAPNEPAALPVLGKITPASIVDPDDIGGRLPAKRIETSAPPPRPAAYNPNKIDILLPTDQTIGQAPEHLKRTSFTVLETIVVAPEKTVTPITPPNVVYPPRMADKRIEGTCDVRFDVSARGDPYNIKPDCTHSGFERSAKRAVASSRFSPKVSNGKPVERRNVVYPIEYRMND